MNPYKDNALKSVATEIQPSFWSFGPPLALFPQIDLKTNADI